LTSPYLKILRSEIKTNILLNLYKKKMALAELRAEVGSRDTTILHALKDLEDLKLTDKFERKYMLTTLGIMEAVILQGYSITTETLSKFRDFWLQHEIKTIPPQLQRRIGDLYDSILIKNESSELAKVHENFLKILQNSKKIIGISPIFHPEWMGAFSYVLSQGASVELILTGEILEKIMKSIELPITKKEERELLTNYLKKERLKIFLNEAPRVALTITENAFTMGLFNQSGEYDYSVDLVSFEHQALEWGRDLFQYFLKNARRILPGDMQL
jgi:predicted transcriptional regulator